MSYPYDTFIPGDIILYRGKKLISKLIRFFDNSEVSHASLYLGDQQVGEALAQGVIKRTFDESIKKQEWVRFMRLKESPADMSPVLNVARVYLDNKERYAYEQILLLAFICITKKLKKAPILGRLLITTLRAASTLIVRLTQGNRQPMICSEYVHRCYEEAVPGKSDIFSLGMRTVDVSIALSVASGIDQPSGVHPDSLLALFTSGSGRVWTQAPSVELSATLNQVATDNTAIEEVIVKAEDEIESIGREYFEQIKTEPQHVSFTQDELAKLRLETERFAAAILFACMEDELTSSIPPVALRFKSLDFLSAKSSDWVTPGDLLKTPNLYEIVEIRP